MQRDTRRVQPSIETLEDRTVPAGNVAAGMIGGSLVVIGDAQPNDITIASAFGLVAITAGGTTTVNGAKSVLFYGFTGHANIDMGGGNDFLTFGPAIVPGALKIQMGGGDDALSVVASMIGMGSFIDGGDGNDSILVGGSLIKGASIVGTGAGNDTANVLGSSFGAATVVGDGGDLLGVSGSLGVASTNFRQSFKAALPTAMSKSVTVAKGGTTKIDVASDAIPGEGNIQKGSVAITQAPQFGTATANADGTITYVNGGSGSPSDTIKYTLRNSAGALSNEATISIAVTGAVNGGGGTGTGTGRLSVNVNANSTSPTKNSPISFTATFSDDVTGFDASDILVANGTVASLTPTSGRTFAFTVNPTGQGTVSAQVKVSSVTKADGSPNAASNVAAVVFDSQAPVVTLLPLPTNSTTPTLRGTVLEAGSTVVVTLTGVTDPSVTRTINAVVEGLNWSAPVVQALTAQPYKVTVTATDKVGNVGTTTNDLGLVIDQTPPTTTITTTAGNPTGLATIPVTIKFSKPVTGFIADDITFSGTGTLDKASFAGSGDTYTINVTQAAGANGSFTVSVAAGVATDPAGNTNALATALTRAVDRVSPSVLLTTTAPEPTNQATFPVTIKFSKPVFNFVAADIKISGPATLDTNSFSGASGSDTYTINVNTTANATGTIKIDVDAGVAADTLGNSNTAAASLTRTLTQAPGVTITTPAPNPTNLPTFTLEIKFSKPVTGFTASDITLTGPAALDLNSFTGTGDTYHIDVNVASGANGTVQVAIAPGVAFDSVTNVGNLAATPMTRLVDRAAPTLKFQLPDITRPANNANNQIILAGTFDEANIASSQVKYHVMKGTTPLEMTVTLFDKDAPANVANFFNYIARYEEDGGIMFQRLPQPNNFVLQGGGYHFNDATNTISAHIAVDDPVRGESAFPSPVLHSNLKGTLALALSTGPNSGTSEWFFNLGNNSASLDGNNNGGPFTVFGEVIAADIPVLENLAATPTKDLTPGTPNTAFENVPLVDGTTLDENNILRITDFEILSRDNQLTYSNLIIANPSVVTGSLGGFQGNTLTLDYLAAGTSLVTFTVTDKAGNATTMSFNVTVT